MINYIIVGAVLLLIAVIVYRGIAQKKKGGGCSGGCSGCSGTCHKLQQHGHNTSNNSEK